MIKLIKQLFKHLTYSRDKFIHQSLWSKARTVTLTEDAEPNGKWICKYSGLEVSSSNLLDVDHIVPLKYAWLHGADKWTDNKRCQLSTDDINLVAVSEHENRSKGDKGLLDYLPPKNKSFYVSHWEMVCDKYNIILSDKEKAVIQKYK